MSFLNLRRTKKEEPIPVKKLVPQSVSSERRVAAAGRSSVHHEARAGILVRPHITEKASEGGKRGCYVFRVDRNATKREIADAVAHLYKVHPIKVTTAAIPAKRIVVKGRSGFRKGGKKAYVFLKKGEKIENI